MKIMTKKEWLEYFNREKGFNSIKYEKIIDGKKVLISYFEKYASDIHRLDKELNVLNFLHDGFAREIPKELIDISFMETILKKKNTPKILDVEYEFKNNERDKKLLKDILYSLSQLGQETRNRKIAWTFEPGFWDDVKFNKEIFKYRYDDLISKKLVYLNNQKEEHLIQFLIEMVETIPYYLTEIKATYKHMLSEDCLLSYAKDYGLKGLTKKIKSNYEVVKAAFHNHQLYYEKLDNMWKTKEYLVDLFNNSYVWNCNVNSKLIISLKEIDKNLLEDKEIIKSIISNGSMLIELKKEGYINWYQDKELKKIALENYVDYKVIEDCLNDKEMVKLFLNKLIIGSDITLFEQTKRIDETVFADKEVMKSLLSIKAFKNYVITYPNNVLNQLNKYSREDLLELLEINPEIYAHLKEHKERWNIVNDYVNNHETVKSIYLSNEFIGLGRNEEERKELLSKKALEEKLQNKLEEKPVIKKPKI